VEEISDGGSTSGERPKSGDQADSFTGRLGDGTIPNRRLDRRTRTVPVAFASLTLTRRTPRAGSGGSAGPKFQTQKGQNLLIASGGRKAGRAALPLT